MHPTCTSTQKKQRKTGNYSEVDPDSEFLDFLIVVFVGASSGLFCFVFSGACASLVTLTSQDIDSSKNNQETKLEIYQPFHHCYFIYSEYRLEEFQWQLPLDCRLDHICLNIKSQFNNECSIFLVFSYNESANKARQDKIQNGKQEMCPTSSVIIITALIETRKYV